MSTTAWLARPPLTERPDTQTWHRNTGLGLGGLGLVIIGVAAVSNWTTAPSAGGSGDTAGTLAGTFAASTFGLGVTKTGIAVILIGIVLALWRRVNAVGVALPELRAGTTDGQTRPLTGDLETPFGPARASARAPNPLTIHRMAEVLWLPVLAMGAMALAVGLVLGLVTSSEAAGTEAFRVASAWSQGTLFLGEGLLLSGISFLLGTILSSLRRGGAEVQESLGVSVHTLKMPATAKAFIALMAIGMMAAIVQFVLYGVAASVAAEPAAYAVWVSWLGPFREVALGVLLAGIVLALASIAKALGFQFHRLRQLAV